MDFPHENDESIIINGLIDKIECCDIGRVGFLKEHPIQDDFYEGWKEHKVDRKNGQTISELLQNQSPSAQLHKEINAILQYIANHDENGVTELNQITENDSMCLFEREFVDCIQDQTLFSKVSKHVPVSLKRVATELKDCVNNFKSGPLLTDRDDIFKSRFKWIVALSESAYKRNLLHFDPCFEFDQFKINADICLEDFHQRNNILSSTILRNIYILENK